MNDVLEGMRKTTSHLGSSVMVMMVREKGAVKRLILKQQLPLLSFLSF